MEDKSVNLSKQREFLGTPGKITIPEAYISGLHYEIVVFVRKERGGNDFTFRCQKYERASGGQWIFEGVIIDTSKRNSSGQVEMVRLTYHPELVLVDTSFMVVCAPEPSDAQT